MRVHPACVSSGSPYGIRTRDLRLERVPRFAALSDFQQLDGTISKTLTALEGTQRRSETVRLMHELMHETKEESP